MDNILVIGAGPTGSNTAALFASKGHHVTLVTRRGGASPHPGVRHVAADAADRRALRPLAHGVKTLVNCAMPAYDRWPEEFPALGASVLAVAAEVGADLVTLSNVYGYGRVAGPLREDHALVPHTVKGRVRAGMWDLVRRSGVRATEVRASDFLGRGAVAYFNIFVLPGLLKGEACAFPGDLDATHSWTFTQDAAATLVAAAGSEASWGRVWHVPSPVASIRELAVLTAEQAGVARPALRRMPLAELQALAAAVPVMREVEEMTYLFEGPCVLDSRETERLLGVHASPLEVAVADNLRPAGMP